LVLAAAPQAVHRAGASTEHPRDDGTMMRFGSAYRSLSAPEHRKIDQ